MSKQTSVQDTQRAVTRTTPAEARYKQLARRTMFDLNLLGDAAMSANVALKHLARIKRARREMKDLVQDLSRQNCAERSHGAPPKSIIEGENT